MPRSAMNDEKRGGDLSAGRRNWPRLGPGLVLAALAGLLLWRFSMDAVTRNTRPVVPERGALPVEPARPAPDLGFVLAMKQELQLSPRQVAALTAIHRRWQGQMTAVQAATERAAADFSREMESRQGKGDTLRGFRESASEVSSLSHQLVGARRGAWEAAVRHLTPFQRRQAEALWHEHLRGH